MINYFNFERRGDKYLLTNDFGKYLFVGAETFNQLSQNCILYDNPDRNQLVEGGFIFDGSPEIFIRNNAPWLRSMKGYCLSGTSLHIFAVTNKCNLDCIYCQAHSRSSSLNQMMTEEIGRKAVEFAIQSPAKGLTFEFQGGEPLLNFDVIKAMIDHSKKINHDKDIRYTIVTNLIYLNFPPKNH